MASLDPAHLPVLAVKLKDDALSQKKKVTKDVEPCANQLCQEVMNLHILYLKNLAEDPHRNLPEEALDLSLLIIQNDMEDIVRPRETEGTKASTFTKVFPIRLGLKNNREEMAKMMGRLRSTISEHYQNFEVSISDYTARETELTLNEQRTEFSQIEMVLREAHPGVLARSRDTRLPGVVQINHNLLKEDIREADRELSAAQPGSPQEKYIKTKLQTLQTLASESTFRLFSSPVVPGNRDGPFMHNLRRQTGASVTSDTNDLVACSLHILEELQNPQLRMTISEVAHKLRNLSLMLAALSFRADAFKVRVWETYVYQQLAKDAAALFEPILATSMNDLSLSFVELGRREEGLAAVEESVTICKRLAHARPKVFNPDLIRALRIMSTHLVVLEQRARALAAIREAVDLCRTLVTHRPDVYRPDLAEALQELSVQLTALEKTEEALAAVKDAIQEYRTLAKDRPETFEPLLATSFIHLANVHLVLENPDDVLKALEEAVRLRRKLVQEQPGLHSAALAESLQKLSVSLSKGRRNVEALEAVEEAVKIRRFLAEENPTAVDGELAKSLNLLALCLTNIGCDEDAAAARREAARLRRT